MSEEIKTEPEEIETVPEPKKAWLTVAIIVAVILMIALVAGLVLLAKNPGAASVTRDIFIILIALQMFVIGVALIVLIIQLASLTNLLQNEVKPILNSTNETVNTLKGTVQFLSDNVSEPVIVLNERLASIKKLADLFHLKR
jgi:membrane protein implicated in regulation of membrane protease activity